MKVLLVDYGLCNIDSIARAVGECGGQAVISEDPDDVRTAERIILPGVGNFAEAMRVLKGRGWDDAIRHETLEKQIPLLGVCLGMQLLASRGYEGGEEDGLDLIPGEIVKMEPDDDTRIPHIGWNEVVQCGKSSIFEGIPNRKDFYFVHSYQFIPKDPDTVLGITPYCGDIVSVVVQDKICGVQFHPEKSLGFGLKLLENFLKLF